MDSAPIVDPYSGTREQRARLRSFTAGQIARYIRAIRLKVPSGPSEETVDIDSWAKTELFVFKQLTWYYVINNSALATQQYGQRQIVRYLFRTFYEAAGQTLPDIFPPNYREQVIQLNSGDHAGSKEHRARIVTDLLAGMTENQAISMYQRLTGMSLGTVLDTIIR